MFDAREPLFQHDLVLTGDGDSLTVWHDGEEQESLTVEGLKSLGEQFEQGTLPDWYAGKDTSWDFSVSGKVLKAVAAKMTEIGTQAALSALYGGNIFGPANPDIQKAGLTIVVNDDRTTLNWRN